MIGPRQTGKTTLVRQVLGQLRRPCQYVSVDEPVQQSILPFPNLDVTVADQPTLPNGRRHDTRWLVQQWEVARQHSLKSERGAVLAIDEIQKIPNWSETVKGLWDADRFVDMPLHVMLLGPAPLLKQQGLGESLADRFETICLMHWSFSELSEAFNFDLDQHVIFR